MNGLVKFNLCSLSDEELVEKVDEKTDALFKRNANRDVILTRHIPALPDEDYDLLVGELCKRFYDKVVKNES